MTAFLLLFSAKVFAASCCVSGGPKSFIQLRRLQKYEVGISSTFKDESSRFDRYGGIEDAEGEGSSSFSFGAGARFLDDWQAFGILPVVLSKGVGDALAGATWTAVDQLFLSDWYPSVLVTGGTKFPTGRETNGLWEPFLGVGLRKTFDAFSLTVSGTFTRPFGTFLANMTEGNKFELVEAVHFPLHPRFSIGAGSAQSWTSRRTQNRIEITGSETRLVSGFLTASYFLTRVMELTATLDMAVPAEGLGKNTAAYRQFLFFVKYGFY